MKTVFSALQLAHAPTRFLSKGHIVDYPESPDRARALLEGAREAGTQICATRKLLDDGVLSRIHDPAYLNFLKLGFRRWQEIDDSAPEMMVSLRAMRPPLFESNHLMAEAGRYLGDFSCAITEHTWRSVEASATTAITAADMLLRGEKSVYALCRPPGHHAYSDMSGGFCYLNNTALATQHLLTHHGKIAILDVDVHHGNGTQAIFYARPDVLTVSIHADPARYYPFYWGSAGETGEGEGEGFNLNLPLPVGSSDNPWLRALDKALTRIQAFEPQALVVALGLDAHEADPLAGGSVTQGGFARIAETIASLNLPTVLVQEGGYLTEHLADNLAMFLTAFEGAQDNSVQSDEAKSA